MGDTEDSSAQISVKSEVIEVGNIANDPPDVCIKVENTVNEENTSGLSMSCTENNPDNVSEVTPSEEIQKSVDNGEDETKAGTEENLNQTPENASLRSKLKALVDTGKHYLQCTALASLEEVERQVSLYKEMTEVQLVMFNKELLRSCPIVITDGAEGFIFKLGHLVTSPLEICFTEKFVTHAGCNSEDKKFSFGYKKFGKGLPTREVFNPTIKRCYEAVLKYVHKSGRPFHVLKKKPPGFWSALTIMCNKKKELLLQIEVHVSTNQYKMQSCELEKLKFLHYFTDGPGKDCGVISLQWKEYVGTVGCMNQVLFGKEFLIERFGDLNLRLYPDDFLFSRPSGVEIVCRVVRELLDLQESDPKVTVLEVGTGTGIVGMHLSKVCKRVHMLDRSDKVCTEHAEANVKLNGIPNCFVHHGDTIQSIKKVTSTVSEADKIYAIIHNNLDTRRVAAEIECIAANQKIKKIVYLSLDHKVRGIRQIRTLCSPSNDTFVPVKVFPLVIVPCYNDVDLAVLLVRQSLLEGNTVENELRENEDASVSVDLSDKNNETEDGRNDDDNDNDHDQSEVQEPPNKKRKPWKEQANGRKGRQKFRKGKVIRLERWPNDCWQDNEELQVGADVQGMDIRKVGFPSYKPPSLLSLNKTPKPSKKPHFQQNEKWSKWQQRSQSWGQSQRMNRGFQQSSQNYGNWYPQSNRYQEMNFDNEDTCGYEEDWSEHQQMLSSAENQSFHNNDQHQFSNSRNQQFNNSHNQQYNSQYSSQNQTYSDAQNRRYSSSQNQQLFSGSDNQQQYNHSQNQQQFYSSQTQPQSDGSQNQQQFSGAQNQQQFNTSQNQHYNNTQNQQFYNNAQLDQFDRFQNQQLNNSQNQQLNSSQTQQLNSSQTQQLNSSQTQQFNSSQNQQFNSPQTQQFNSSQNQQFSSPQTQQFNSSQNQQFNSSQNQQFNSPQNQQFNSPQNQQFNTSQPKPLQDAQQQQFNSPMQINLNPTGQQMQHDASVKSGDPQLNYDASAKAVGANKPYLQYGVAYGSVQQAQNYGTSSWGGQQNTAYNYGYPGSVPSVVPGFNMPATSNPEQQRSWTPFLPQTKFPAGDTNPN